MFFVCCALDSFGSAGGGGRNVEEKGEVASDVKKEKTIFLTLEEIGFIEQFFKKKYEKSYNEIFEKVREFMRQYKVKLKQSNEVKGNNLIKEFIDSTNTVIFNAVREPIEILRKSDLGQLSFPNGFNTISFKEKLQEMQIIRSTHQVLQRIIFNIFDSIEIEKRQQQENTFDVEAAKKRQIDLNVALLIKAGVNVSNAELTVRAQYEVVAIEDLKCVRNNKLSANKCPICSSGYNNKTRMWYRGYIPMNCQFAPGWSAEGYQNAFVANNRLLPFDSYDSFLESLREKNITFGENDLFFAHRTSWFDNSFPEQQFRPEDNNNMVSMFQGFETLVRIEKRTAPQGSTASVRGGGSKAVSKTKGNSSEVDRLLKLLQTIAV